MQKWEYKNRKDFVIGALDVLGHDAPSEDDVWTSLLVIGLERAFAEPVLIVIDDLASVPSVLARTFADNEQDLGVAQTYFTSCFARNSGKAEKDQPARFFALMPKSMFTEDGSEETPDDEPGYIIARVDEEYVCEFFDGKIAPGEE